MRWTDRRLGLLLEAWLVAREAKTPVYIAVVDQPDPRRYPVTTRRGRSSAAQSLEPHRGGTHSVQFSTLLPSNCFCSSDEAGDSPSGGETDRLRALRRGDRPSRSARPPEQQGRLYARGDLVITSTATADSAEPPVALVLPYGARRHRSGAKRMAAYVTAVARVPESIVSASDASYGQSPRQGYGRPCEGPGSRIQRASSISADPEDLGEIDEDCRADPRRPRPRPIVPGGGQQPGHR